MGINAVAFAEHGHGGMIGGRVLPWAQDKEEENVWESWQVEIRDFFVLDATGQFFDIINLTLFDPDPSYGGGINYQILKSMLLDARGP